MSSRVLEDELRRIVPKLPPPKRLKRAGGEDGRGFVISAKTRAETWMAFWKERPELGCPAALRVPLEGRE